MTPRPRQRILDNLDTVYREAYDKARELNDAGRMQELDASYQREQLLLEVLLDIRDGLYTLGEAPDSSSALEKISQLRKLIRR
ncbi:MAG: hypothetical protein WD934_07835 [Gemmatimonadales bacterium]|jgi:hypothetical protein